MKWPYRIITLSKDDIRFLWRVFDVTDEYFVNNLDEEERKHYHDLSGKICHWGWDVALKWKWIRFKRRFKE